MGLGVKISLVVLGIVSIGALMAFAFYFGKQSRNPSNGSAISVTGEPSEMPAVTEEVLMSPTPEASISGTITPTKTVTITPSATPTGKKLNIPNLRVIPSATPTVTKLVIPNLRVIPSATPAQTVKLPLLERQVIPQL